MAGTWVSGVYHVVEPGRQGNVHPGERSEGGGTQMEVL